MSDEGPTSQPDGSRAASPAGDGTGAKVGIAAGLLAALGGFARFADDCGRVGLSTADDVARAGRPGAGLVDEAARPAHLMDDAARSPRLLDDAAKQPLPAVLDDAASPLAKVAGDPAPGSGEAWEELLIDAGSNLAFELSEYALSEREPPSPMQHDIGGHVLVTDGNPAHAKELERVLQPGLIAIFVGSKAADGKLLLGTRRVTDTETHAMCYAAGARCVVLLCDEARNASCGALAAGMGRMALSKIDPKESLANRNSLVGKALLLQRERVAARYITVSRAAATPGKLVRSAAPLPR